MPIYRPDGSTYQTKGSVQQFDPKGSANELFNRYNKEIIEIGGSPIFYHELFIPSQSIDKLYIESRSKMWSQHPIEVMASYEPLAPQLRMSLFGPDGHSESMVFYTNYQHFLERVGHPPVIGSRIYTPQMKENWEVLDRRTGGFQNWGIVVLEIHCKLFQESLTTGEGRVSQPKQDYDIV